MGCMKRWLCIALVAPCVAWSQPIQPTTAKLIGIWQCTHEMAAGWNEAYQLLPGGKVIWHANQMDTQKRLISRTGTWTLTGRELRLRYSSELVTVGGKLVPGSGGDGESEIQGGKDMVRKLAKPIVKVLKLSNFDKRNGYPSALFGKIRYWKMRTDPNDYQ